MVVTRRSEDTTSDFDKVIQLTSDIETLREQVTLLLANRLPDTIPSPLTHTTHPNPNPPNFKIIQLTCLDEQYWLKGHPHDSTNNWDSFSHHINRTFSDLGLWNTETNTPTVACTAHMIEKNISAKLQAKYKKHNSASGIWEHLSKDYSGSTILQQSRIIKMATQFKFTTDVDHFIAKTDEMKRAFSLLLVLPFKRKL